MLIICLLFLHIVVSFCYFFVYVRSNFSQALSEFIICISIPIFGILYLLLAKLAHKVSYSFSKGEEYKHEKLSNPKAAFASISEYDTNVIPLSDVLYLDDMDNKRELLTNAIRQDTLTDHKLLFKAVKDSDREVSHYAVSMVTNMIETLESQLFTLEKQMLASPEDYNLQTAYADTMAEYLKIGFLDPLTKEKYLNSYRLVLRKIVTHPSAPEYYYQELFECELNLSDYEQAERICAEFLAKFPRNEIPYLLYVKLYQQLKNYGRLKTKIQELKNCPVRLSPEAMKIIRFWDGGVQNV